MPARVTLIASLLAALVISVIISLEYLPDVGAQSCETSLTILGLNTVHSSRIAAPQAGERVIITTEITSSCALHQPIVIAEVRDTDGITEYFGQQLVTINQTSTGTGFSWVPLHGGVYQLRAFVINNLSRPALLSELKTWNVTFDSVENNSVISILPAPYQPLNQSNFLPQNITVVLGVNNTVQWTNGDLSSHSLEGVLANSTGINFGMSIYPDYSSSYTYLEPGLYVYYDKDRPWMRGYVNVLVQKGIESKILNHDISLIVTSNETSALTTHAFSVSEYLVNNANHTERVHIEGNALRFYELGVQPGGFPPTCLYGNHSSGVPSDYFESVIPAGKRLTLFENMTNSSPSTPGIYRFDGPVVVAIADMPTTNSENNTLPSVPAKCLYIFPSETFRLNVTAMQYEGVSMFLQSDKQTYTRNENVSFVISIQNNGNKPFAITEVEPSIQIIQKSTGKQVYRIGYVADYVTYPTIQPHATYNFHDTQLIWNQVDATNNVRVTPGEYLVKAVFQSPYLESQTYTIEIK